MVVVVAPEFTACISLSLGKSYSYSRFFFESTAAALEYHRKLPPVSVLHILACTHCNLQLILRKKSCIKYIILSKYNIRKVTCAMYSVNALLRTHPIFIIFILVVLMLFFFFCVQVYSGAYTFHAYINTYNTHLY